MGIVTINFSILIVSSNDAAIERAQKLQSQHGIKASAYKVDGMLCSFAVLSVPLTNATIVSNVEQVQNTMVLTEQHFGKIDVFVANAGSRPSTIAHH